MRPMYLVGESPSTPGARPLTGRTGDNLARLAGVESREDLDALVTCANLCDAGWDLGQARAKADMLRRTAPALIVMLGRRVEAAFGYRRSSWYAHSISLVGFETVCLVAFPHPSPRSRFWNDVANRRTAAAVLQDLIRSHGSM